MTTQTPKKPRRCGPAESVSKVALGNCDRGGDARETSAWVGAACRVGSEAAPISDGGAPISDFVAPIGDGGAPIWDLVAPTGDGGAPILDFVAPISDGGAPIWDFTAP
ncbi:MAG: hypothetical protein KDM64_13610, partial [Verrucomicrobiae bacterium]|nr:hypothetical protein [Verrucomicrobiae bacterium]